MRPQDLVDDLGRREIVAVGDVAARVVQRPIPIALDRRDDRWELSAGRKHQQWNHDSMRFRHTATSTFGVDLGGAVSGRLFAPGASIGSVTTNVVPSPTLLSTVVWPPWASTISFAIARPKPVPLVAACAWLSA